MSSNIVPYSRPKRLVSKELRAKEKLDPWEAAWVYREPVVMAVSVPMLGLLWVWATGSYTLQGVGWFLLVLFALLYVYCGVEAILRCKDALDNPYRNLPSGSTNAYHLTYPERRKLVLLDRNRRRAPHKLDRSKFPAEAKKKYKQYSVWVEAQRRGITFTIVEHSPQFWRYYWPSIMAYNGWEAERSVIRASNEDEHEFYGRAIETQYRLDEIAAKAEFESYNKTFGQLEVQRTALTLRR